MESCCAFKWDEKDFVRAACAHTRPLCGEQSAFGLPIEGKVRETGMRGQAKILLDRAACAHTCPLCGECRPQSGWVVSRPRTGT